ncbi:helix-turn-helix domain-containing protein [Psychrobacter sp. H7-1]|uniref:helix-turn-helix domain-containing protein n=1 Tax=Psychrobacter sp. H7-1 TaxID=1569265 RepID=UPI00191B2659|nr:helix-turn-helix transcriptional regulator [Psychrobacter sp. H7-1]
MSNLFLAEERSRPGLKAKGVADYAGIAIPTQSNYKKSKRCPDAQYLIKIAELGFDINYVITGRRDSLLLTTQEKLLAELFKQLVSTFKCYCFLGWLPL